MGEDGKREERREKREGEERREKEKREGEERREKRRNLDTIDNLLPHIIHHTSYILPNSFYHMLQ